MAENWPGHDESGVRYQPIDASASEAPRPLACWSSAVYHRRNRSSVGLEIKTNKIARERVMPRRSIFTSVSFLVLLGLLAGADAAAAQTIAPALTLKFTAEQGALEGVLVSANKSGSTITITVVSDKDGRYAFPAVKLEPGQYSCLLYTSPSPRDRTRSRMPSSASK